jgi:WD40 repeat protein
MITCGADSCIKIFRTNDYTCIKTLQGHDDSVSAVCMVKNEEVVSVSKDTTCKVWDVSTGYLNLMVRFCKKTLVGHSGWVKCVACSPDGQFVATAGSDHVWVSKLGYNNMEHLHLGTE